MKEKRQKAMIYRKAEYASGKGKLQDQLALALHSLGIVQKRLHDATGDQTDMEGVKNFV